jgi:hypothetical protein
MAPSFFHLAKNVGGFQISNEKKNFKKNYPLVSLLSTQKGQVTPLVGESQKLATRTKNEQSYL